MKQLLILILAGCLLFPTKGKSQEQFSIDKLLKNDTENSHAMKKAALQENESNAKRKEAVANGLPQVGGDLSYSRMGIPEIEISQEMVENLPEDLAPLIEGHFGINALHTSSAGITVNQLLYSKSYLTGVEQDRKAEELYQVMLEKTENDVIYDVATTYYQILASRATLEILDKNITTLEQLYNILKLQYENDFVKSTDVSRLKVTVTNFNNLNTIGLTATIPIFSSGMRKQKVLQSQLKLEQNMEYFKLNSKYLTTNYKNATNSLLSALSNLQVQKENTELATGNIIS